MSETIKTVAVMASEQTHIKADVAEIKSDVKKIMGRDGRRWEWWSKRSSFLPSPQWSAMSC